MTDNHSPQVRSYNMSRIRSDNTKPEEYTAPIEKCATDKPK